MAKKDKIEETEKKVVTKYDRKMERRAREKAQEKKEKKLTAIGGMVLLLVVVALVLIAPINTYMTIHNSYIEVAGEKITKVEYDYNYNIVKNNYINTYGNYLSYFGLDVSQDFSTQMYSDTLTWADYFDQLTVDNLKRSKALKQDAEKNSFVHDTLEEEYQEFMEDVTQAASDEGMKTTEYLKGLFGPYATASRIEDYVKEGLVVSAYNDKITKDNAPSEEEITSYYEENKDEYDSVDYKQVIVKAELPTEPTELADPVEEGSETDEDAAYTPSEAEIEKAMELALAQAEEAQETVADDGELQENVRRVNADVIIKDWLFAEERKASDTVVLRDDDYHQYYVLSFEKRYRDESATANVRVIALSGDGQAALEQWNQKGGTEDAFIQLGKEIGITDYENDGLFENVSKNSLGEVFDEWIFAEGRKSGDAGVVEYDENTQYLLYYVGEGAPLWHSEIESTITNDRVTEYIEGLTETIVVNDSKGKLNYLKVEAEQKASEEAAAQESETVSEEEGNAETEEESAE